MRRAVETPLGAAARGLVAGLIGNAAMTAHLVAPDDSEGDSAEDRPEDPWEQAPAPAKVGRRISEGVFDRRVPPERIPLLANAMHWGYGALWCGLYGLVQGTVRGNPYHLTYGLGVALGHRAVFSRTR